MFICLIFNLEAINGRAPSEQKWNLPTRKKKANDEGAWIGVRFKRDKVAIVLFLSLNHAKFYGWYSSLGRGKVRDRLLIAILLLRISTSIMGRSH